MSNFFILYQDCTIIKGSKNILLSDFYKNKIINITEFYSYFIRDRYLNISNGSDDLHELVEFLSGERLGYISDDLSSIQKKNFIWRTPNEVNEVIIEHQKNDTYNPDLVYKIIETLSAEFLQIRFIDFSFKKLTQILELVKNSSIRTIEVLIPFWDEAKNDKIIKKLEKELRIQIIYFYNSPKNISRHENCNIIYYQKNITDVRHCGIINEDYFLNDIRNISKTKIVNNCLYDKIFISLSGDIKNCPSMPNIICNVNDFSNFLFSEKYKAEKNRYITKDKVKICRDCEYRYFCIDCRAYKEDPDDDYSKPLKCGYNPYTGKWEEWSKNPLKQKAIQYYGMQNFS
ncbi:grasp-with-spasm system SPASM domain peptide maturase [Chryseobacterium elymi]|uniref:Grasp-with-spasm system SPASM domain peptide maturase n=1 Tax=Chryseobacterium elymi TaxID=395936 RepID=A0A3D9DIX7_9FLAO|nr:grasp-with-spasm system SPASM domain peptide maturase [Chryseobacterium elymi]REC77942.1 grasp-with-spasm system SPASM domain peptide maturase [Chryseobacterium elymi]